MVRLHERALSPDPARREVAAAILGRQGPPLGEAHARIAAGENVAPLLERSGARFVDEASASIVAESARISAIRSIFLDEELRRVCDALDARGLSSVVIKGAHLAHALYPSPLFRPRSDTDLLIDPGERGAVQSALIDAGYQPAVHVRGSIILGQFHFEKRDRSGVMHYLDVHWRAAAPLVVERVLPAREILDRRQPLPSLGAGARGPALDDALALSCIHVVAHHWPGLELRWAYDLRLLAHAVGPDGRERFAAAAERRGYRTVAAHALAAASALFDDDALSALAARLDSAASPEPSAALLDVTRPVDALWLDLRTAGWRDRLRLLREHLVPHPEYMRATMGGRPLALAYTSRAWNGVRRWFSASASDRTEE